MEWLRSIYIRDHRRLLSVQQYPSASDPLSLHLKLPIRFNYEPAPQALHCQASGLVSKQ